MLPSTNHVLIASSHSTGMQPLVTATPAQSTPTTTERLALAMQDSPTLMPMEPVLPVLLLENGTQKL
jgi:hypothetical protein